ncbi:hypothetical protein GCM10009594_22690 [Kocuria palustris]
MGPLDAETPGCHPRRDACAVLQALKDGIRVLSVPDRHPTYDAAAEDALGIRSRRSTGARE